MEKPLIRKMREDYGYFGGMSLLYGVIFAFCMYRNTHGITFIIYTLATIVFALLFMKRINFRLQKKSKRYFIGMILLSIAMFFSTEFFFITCNWIGMILLFGMAMIHQFYDDSRWNLPAFLQRMLIVFGTAIGTFFYPFKHGSQYLSKQDTKKKKTVYAVLIGGFVGICLLAVILPLLLSSDRVFAEFFGELLNYINLPTLFGVGITLTFGFVACYSFFSSLCQYNFPAESDRKMKYYNPLVGITFTSILAIIYLLYCGVQVLYLFLGLEKGLPEALSYAQYARSGFWELLFVSIINFILVLICMYVFYENKILKIILTVISGCTYIMLISAAYRMFIYIDQYHLTFMRLLVLWFLFVLALIMGGTIISIYKKSFPLFRYITLVISICYIVFALVRPNYWVAQYNVANTEDMELYELGYLMNQYSEDAAPAIAKIDIEKMAPTVDEDTLKGKMYTYFYHLAENNDDVFFRKANFSRIRAKQIAENYLDEHEEDKRYANIW